MRVGQIDVRHKIRSGAHERIPNARTARGATIEPAWRVKRQPAREGGDAVEEDVVIDQRLELGVVGAEGEIGRPVEIGLQAEFLIELLALRLRDIEAGDDVAAADLRIAEDAGSARTGRRGPHSEDRGSRRFRAGRAIASCRHRDPPAS